MFTIGGTDINIHKFLGAENPAEGEGTADQPTYDAVKETNIQDLLFLEIEIESTILMFIQCVAFIMCKILTLIYHSLGYF